MNFEQFENLLVNIINKRTGLIRKAANIRIEVNDDGNGSYDINAYDGDQKIGFIEFYANDTNKAKHIYVPMVLIHKKYQGTSVGLKLLNKFREIYKEKYWGWPITAQFVNQKLHDTFQHMIDSGKFPPGVNQTSVDAIDDQDQFNRWEATQHADYFNDPSLLIEKAPKPYKDYNFVNKENDISKVVSQDVIYKNISAEELSILDMIAYHFAKANFSLYAIDQIGDVYVMLNHQTNINNAIASDIQPQILYDYWAEKTSTNDLKFLNENIGKLSSYVDELNLTQIFVQEGKPFVGDFSGEEIYVNNVSEIGEILEEKQEKVSRLRR